MHTATRHDRRLVGLAFGLACCAGIALARAAEPEGQAGELGLELRRTADRVYFVAHGLPETLLARLAKADDAASGAQEVLSVFVGQEVERDRPPLLGRYRVEGRELLFEPRFPLRPGRQYRAVLRGSAPGGEPGARGQLTRVFAVPGVGGPPTIVAAVYPSGDVLPENQLKFYLHFSAPMTQGVAFRHLRLLDGRGQPDELPFVDVGQELWDRSGTRLTLLLDPGRIKHGLKPREEQGPILHEGDEHTLVIDAAWPDAHGRPLAKPHEKRFRVGPPDAVQPDVARWRLAAPPAGSREPLGVDFDEPLDRAMLLRVLVVLGPEGRPVEGEPSVANQERRWRFTPKAAWRPGAHRIEVEATLEDLAGNSLERPFEVDLFERVDGPGERPSKTTVPFEVR
jgi:hypothetical protein